MHRIHYAGGSVLTGDAIADALLEYAAALARNATSATVQLPVRDADGTSGIAQVLIGPASQLVSTNEPSDPTGVEPAEIEDAELVERFRQETRRLEPSEAVPLRDGQATVPIDDYDLPLN